MRSMKISRLLTVLTVALSLAGCFSLDSSRDPATGNEHVLVSNYGWRLFNCIPLFCGNAYNGRDQLGPWAFFRDDVTLEKIQGRFMDYAKENGRTISDLSYHNYETVLFTIPSTAIPIPIPYIVCYREIQLSGVVK